MQKIKLHWTQIVILLTVSILIGSVGVGYLIQTNPTIRLLDRYGFNFLQSHFHSKILDILIYPFNFNFLPFGGPQPVFLIFLLIPVFIYLWIYKRSYFFWFIANIIIAGAISWTATFLDWHFVFRQRPFLVIPTNVPLSAQKIWGIVSSFPSGHSRDTTLIATLIASLIPELSIPCLILALFVAFSRVYLGAHYPTDVIAGLAIGYLSAKTSLIVSRELQIIYEERRGVKNKGVPKQEPTDIKKG